MFPLNLKQPICGKSEYSSLQYSGGIMPKRVESGEAHLRGLAPGQPSFEQTSQ